MPGVLKPDIRLISHSLAYNALYFTSWPFHQGIWSLEMLLILHSTQAFPFLQLVHCSVSVLEPIKCRPGAGRPVYWNYVWVRRSPFEALIKIAHLQRWAAWLHEVLLAYILCCRLLLVRLWCTMQLMLPWQGHIWRVSFDIRCPAIIRQNYLWYQGGETMFWIKMCFLSCDYLWLFFILSSE